MTLDELCVNSLRFLSVDCVEKARSGHPGAPMGMAAMVYTLWQKHLKHDPGDPSWPDRDRFVLSAGHASALLYSLLHVYGYSLPLEELKSFRQLGSKTPGHPEYDREMGIETTTGPLGQGVANAVGMAMAERWLAGHFNRPGFEIIDHYTYVVASDGDMMEGVAAEAASFAGAQKLGRLICLYDDNKITIEGSTNLTFTENVAARFRAYGWHVIEDVDGLDIQAVDSALKTAREESEKPSLIICSTLIGYGSPGKAGTASAHGEPLGQEEAQLTRQQLGWKYEPFEIPDEASQQFNIAKERGKHLNSKWSQLFKEYSTVYPGQAKELTKCLEGELPRGWSEGVKKLFEGESKPAATREASGIVLNAIAKNVNMLIGGSADLAPSNKTILKEKGHFSPGDRMGHNIHFGVREHAMGAIANGLSLHGGVLPYIATFLIFSDYMRPPIRLAGIMGIRVIYIFTHDSIGLGEDGPTHQPVEQLMGLRLVPNLVTIRPADNLETAQAWEVALNRQRGPTALVLTRQKVPQIQHKVTKAEGAVARGAYIVKDTEEMPELILISTGSEVHIALAAAGILNDSGIDARVVSMPSWELFDSQDEEYRNKIFPPEVSARISIEAGVTSSWYKYIGEKGIAIGVDRYGLSAPWEEVYRHMGITASNIVKKALKLLGKD